MTTPGLLAVYCDETSAPTILEALRSVGGEPQSSRRNNLDGAAATTWLVVAAVAVRQAPDFVRALGEVLDRLRVESIDLDGVVIHNPRGKDVDRLLDQRDHREDESRNGDDLET